MSHAPPPSRYSPPHCPESAGGVGGEKTEVRAWMRQRGGRWEWDGARAGAGALWRPPHPGVGEGRGGRGPGLGWHLLPHPEVLGLEPVGEKRPRCEGGGSCPAVDTGCPGWGWGGGGGRPRTKPACCPAPTPTSLRLCLGIARVRRGESVPRMSQAGPGVAAAVPEGGVGRASAGGHQSHPANFSSAPSALGPSACEKPLPALAWGPPTRQISSWCPTQE